LATLQCFLALFLSYIKLTKKSIKRWWISNQASFSN